MNRRNFILNTTSVALGTMFGIPILRKPQLSDFTAGVEYQEWIPPATYKWIMLDFKLGEQTEISSSPGYWAYRKVPNFDLVPYRIQDQEYTWTIMPSPFDKVFFYKYIKQLIEENRVRLL